jgi:hypothetical protein
MRKLINLNRERQKTLSAQFPDLNNWGEDNQFDTYKVVYLTVFDRCLSEDECITNFGPDIDKEERKRRDNAFLCFRRLLFAETEVITYRNSSKGARSHLLFKAFTSNDAGLKYSIPTIQRVGFYLAGSRERFFQLVLPELNAIYLEGYDDTNTILYKNKSTLELIKTWAKDSKLFCL